MRPKTTQAVWAIALTVLSLATARSAFAQQLDENCTISVLNRNVRVRPDGSWVLPNVPANFGPVRARVTCIVDGQTVSGESDPFLVPTNGVVNRPHIVFGQTTPIPRSVSVTAPVATLTQLGASAQLTVTATYADGTTKDVTSGSGTQYTISNPAIATVSADGLVQAVQSGTVVIQATLEGSSGITSIRIAPSGVDTDGDGIPDDYEIAHGLNPNNPVDAQEDPDHDGLTNLQEYLLGTDPHNADTDGDGLTDGDEVNRYHTNPLLWDTDGDGISDGLEVGIGTDPLDGTSFNLAAALASIAVTPSSFVLSFNTIAGDATVRLTVSGTMLDGRPINLTARGVNYASSDLNICNFGATPGEVFAGSSGTCTITATIATFSTTATGTVRSFSPTALSFVSIPGFANNVDVSGDFAYVAAGSAGLQIVDVSNRMSPHIVASLALPGNANDVKLDGTRAYIAAGTAGLHIVDISSPSAPRLLGSVTTPAPGDAYDVRPHGNLAYVADGPAGLLIIDVSSPDHPRIAGSVAPPGVVAHGVDVNGQIAVVAAGFSGLQVYNVANPAAPVLLGSVPLPDEAKDVIVNGTIAYVADYTGSLQTVDFSIPTAPRVIDPSTPLDPNNSGYLMDVAFAPPFVFGADVKFFNGVPISDVSTPSDPRWRTILDFRSIRDDDGTGIAVDGNYVYLTTNHGIQENGASGDGRLYIGQYRALEDLKGIAPTVSIVSPADGATFIEGETIPISVSATDDVAVVSVNFLVDGAVAFTDTSAPYQFSIPAATGAGSHTLSATAIDLGSNIGVAANVRVNVIPDPLTTVVGRVVDNTQQPLAGVTVSVPGRSSTTALDGTFSITGVSTLQPVVIVSASLSANGTILTGLSAPAQPVRGGTTDVGDIVAAATSFENNLGTLTPACDYCTVTVPLPFAFTIGANTYSQIHINNGYVYTDGGDSIEAFCCDLSSTPGGGGGGAAPGDAGLYVNDQLPGRLVVTWWKKYTFDTGQDLNTIQIILFADGRIQYGYQTVSPAAYAEVGLFPRNASRRTQVDFASTPNLSAAAGEAVYEDFAPSANPFNLGGGFVIFTPAPGGGYAIHPVPDVTPPVCTVITPADGATLFEGERLNVEMSASDNGGVSHVHLLSNVGDLDVNLTTAPYTASFVVPVGVTSVTFSATAFDGWGNNAVCTSTASVIPGPPPTVTITSVAAGATFVAGATVPIAIDATNRVPVTKVDFSVNGVALSSDVQPPFEFLFTVPSGVATLALSAVATDSVGKTGTSQPLSVAVTPDPLTIVQGLIVDKSSAPIADADVTANVHGATVEIFNSDTTLTGLPNLDGRTPDKITIVSAINLRNPGAMFGADPFGLGTGASRAMRMTATLKTIGASSYTFKLGVKAGGRLLVNGVTVVDLPTDTGQFQEGTGTIAVTQATLSIEILTFDNGNPEVQLSYAVPGESELEVVPTSELTPTPTLVPYHTTSQADGTFSIPGVPTTLGAITVTASKTVDGRTGRAHSAATQPVPGGATAVGTLRLFDFGTLYGASFNGPSGPASLYSIDPATGSATLVGPIGFWRVGAIDVSADGTMYAIGRDPATGRNVLLTIDPSTGAGTEIGPTGVESLGFGDTIADLAFRPSDGVLFAYLEAADGLGTINLATGAATVVGRTLVSCCGNGMAFAPDGRLLHANESALHVLDQTTGVATVLVPLTYPGLSFPRIASMKFQPDTGQLFGFMKTNSNNGTYLVKVDTASGVVTIVGPRTLDGLDAIAWGPGR